jgi:hypothetical protein
MSSTLSKGFKLPATGDRNFWTDLATNITKTNAHTHNGVDSEAINITNLVKPTSTLVSTSWVAVAGEAGSFKQSVIMPVGVLFDNVIVKVQLGSEQIFPTIVKTAASSFDITVNDNTMNLAITYV